VKQLGGTAVVQDPADALVPFMPLNAVTHVKVDYCLPLEEIAPLLVRLTTEAAEEEGAFQVPKEVEIEVNIAKEQKALDAGVPQLTSRRRWTTRFGIRSAPSRKASCSCDIWPNIWTMGRIVNRPNRFSNVQTRRNDEPI